MSKKPKIARILSLKGFDGVLIGRDLGNILENGVVSQVLKIDNTLLLHPLGEHALPDWGCDSKGNHQMGGKISQYVMTPCVYLTKTEREIEKKNIANGDDPEFGDDNRNTFSEY